MALLAAVAGMVTTGAMAAQTQATLAGKWRGETRNGSAIALDLAVKDATLTGTFTRSDVSTPISDGKVSKNTFTFKANVQDQAEEFSGELAGDELRIWLERQGPTRAIVLKRVKDA
jgi:hypothetical protein